jgi:hypothetical protein
VEVGIAMGSDYLELTDDCNHQHLCREDVHPVFLSIDFVVSVSKRWEVWSSGSISQCLVNKCTAAKTPHAIQVFFNVLVYPLLLFVTQTLEIRERSHHR